MTRQAANRKARFPAIAAGVVGALSLMTANLAHARHFGFGAGFGYPVYYAPPVYRVYAPPPVYPVYYAPPVVYHYGYRSAARRHYHHAVHRRACP